MGSTIHGHAHICGAYRCDPLLLCSPIALWVTAAQIHSLYSLYPARCDPGDVFFIVELYPRDANLASACLACLVLSILFSVLFATYFLCYWLGTAGLANKEPWCEKKPQAEYAVFESRKHAIVILYVLSW